MTASIRRVVRFTVLLPDGQVDVAVADDAVGAEVVRVARAARGPASPSGREGWDGLRDGDVHGWLLVHPTRGPLPLETPLREVSPDGGPGDGAVLSLVPRGPSETAPPVDDVAEHVVATTHRPTGGVRPTLTGLLSLAVPGVAVAVQWASGRDVRDAALATLLVALGLVLVARRRADGLVLGTSAVVVMALAAAVTASPNDPVVVLCAGAIATAVGAALLAALDDRMRSCLVAATATSALSGLVAAVGLLGPGAEAAAVGACGTLLLVGSATRLSLTSSGLARVDDRVARGEHVIPATVDAALDRASHDLTALTWVAGLATVALAMPLTSAGWWGSGVALVLALVVATHARSLRRARHVMPLLLGGAVCAVSVVMWAAAQRAPGTVVALGVALAALVAVAGSGPGTVHPVTASRLRRTADLACRVGTLVMPLLVVGVFDLYRVVWAWSGS